ncbi:MAG: ATP-binding protein [Eubacterium sp.]|nr:ATP-binding protein [Eubacterium sp.]
MSLTNEQYNLIKRVYDDKSLKNSRLRQSRIEEIHALSPRFEELDSEISSLAVASAKRALSGASSDGDFREKAEALRAEKREILRSLGYPADYLEPIYDCPRCKDTGYVDNEKCVCFKRLAVRLLLDGSNLKSVLGNDSFDTFRLDFYDKETRDISTGISAYDAAKYAYDHAYEFAHEYPEKFGNAFVWGDVGCGKTYLTHCVARVFMERGMSVAYFPASDLFDLFGDNVFNKDVDVSEECNQVFNCDLLIIDDLGTEFTNSFIVAELFKCLNNRLLNRKPIMISTNLPLEKITEKYTERVFSRIASEYMILHLFGADIRILKRMENLTGSSDI